jgi:hypothetical protein
MASSVRIQDIRLGDEFEWTANGRRLPVTVINYRERYIVVGNYHWSQDILDHALLTYWTFRGTTPRHLTLPQGV